MSNYVSDKKMHLKEEIQTESIISNALWNELPVNFLIILDCWIDCFNVIYLKLIDLAESLELFIELLYGELL